MNQDTAIQLAMQALIVALKVAVPFLIAGLVVGLLVSVFQAGTQIQEQTLTFIPKILVTGAVIAIAGPWMLDQMIDYTRRPVPEHPVDGRAVTPATVQLRAASIASAAARSASCSCWRGSAACSCSAPCSRRG